MTDQQLLNTFTEVKECDYKGEHYSVRDNGAIMRHPKTTRVRPKDNIIIEKEFVQLVENADKEQWLQDKFAKQVHKFIEKYPIELLYL